MQGRYDQINMEVYKPLDVCYQTAASTWAKTILTAVGGIWRTTEYSDNACTTNTTNPDDTDYYDGVCTLENHDVAATMYVKWSKVTKDVYTFKQYTASGCADGVALKDVAAITFDQCVITSDDPPMGYKHTCATATGAVKKVFYNSTTCATADLLGEVAVVTGTDCTTTTDGIGGSTVYYKASEWLCGSAPSGTSTAGTSTSTNGTSAAATTTGSALVSGATGLLWSWVLFPLAALLLTLTTQ